MSGRQRFLVTYDIRDPKRLRRVFKLMKGYGDHLQLSVFRCDLTPMTLVLMRAALMSEIHAAEDEVLIIDVGPTEGRGAQAFETLGRAALPEDEKSFVV